MCCSFNCCLTHAWQLDLIVPQEGSKWVQYQTMKSRLGFIGLRLL